MWVYCSHDKDSTDQHSLWEDASGNIWSMEIIEASRIKFTRYQDHTAPMPLGTGTLHHYQNATHTADIDYDETVYVTTLAMKYQRSPIYRTNPFVTVEGNGRGRTNAYIKGSGIDVGADIFRRGLCFPSDNKMTEEQSCNLKIC